MDCYNTLMAGYFERERSRLRIVPSAHDDDALNHGENTESLRLKTMVGDRQNACSNILTPGVEFSIPHKYPLGSLSSRWISWQEIILNDNRCCDRAFQARMTYWL